MTDKDIIKELIWLKNSLGIKQISDKTREALSHAIDIVNIITRDIDK